MANKFFDTVSVQKILCLFIFFSSLRAEAQLKIHIDSLKYAIAHAAANSEKLRALVQLNEINPDRQELVDGYKEQIILSLKIKDYHAACTGYSQLGYFEYEKNNLMVADSLFAIGIKLAKKTHNDFVLGRMYNSMMCIYDKKGDLPTAIYYLKQSEQLLIKEKKWKNLTRLYCNASNVYSNHTMLAKASEYVRKSYATALLAQAEGDNEPMTTASWYLGNNLKESGKYDSAIHYFTQGLHIAEKLEIPYTQGDMLRGLSDVFAEQKDYPKAVSYLEKAKIMYDSVHVPDRVIECEESLAYIAFMNKKFDQVKNYVLVRQATKTEDSLQNNRYVNKWLANLALAENDMEVWKSYAKKYEQADAALSNEKIQKNLLELEAKYDISIKETALKQKELENRKRLWVIGALVLGLISLITILLLQFRNHSSKKKIAAQRAIIEKQNALAEERLRIAADMHDDVGAGISRIRYITAGMKGQVNVKQEEIDSIVSLSDESVEKMNEIIWSLNQGNQQLEEILYFTRSQCSEMISNAGIDFTFSLQEKIPAITLSWMNCRNIYLLVKEAVNNAIKHAGANQITIDILVDQQLVIVVQDDGKGFDPSALKNSGNGLRNYKKRMDHLRGSYTLQSAPGQGTILQFDIPLL